MKKLLTDTSPKECAHCQKYYRLKTLAATFDISEKTLRRMITEGRLKAKRIGGSIRIPHAELIKIIQEY